MSCSYSRTDFQLLEMLLWSRSAFLPSVSHEAHPKAPFIMYKQTSKALAIVYKQSLTDCDFCEIYDTKRLAHV
jgi:hypothetical protein